MYQLVFSNRAQRAFKRIPANTASLIQKKLGQLALDPMRPNNNVKTLAGRPGYRLRVGVWRIIYTLEHAKLIIQVIDVGPRGSIYN